MNSDNHQIECSKLYSYSNYIHHIGRNVILHNATVLNHPLNHFSIVKRSVTIISVRLDFHDVGHRAADCVSVRPSIRLLSQPQHNSLPMQIHAFCGTRGLLYSLSVFEVEILRYIQNQKPALDIHRQNASICTEIC